MNPHYHYLMRWESRNHVIRAFLRQLPLIFKTPAGGLCGLTALDEAPSGRDRAAPIERALPTEGLERLFIIAPPGDVSTGIDTGLPEGDGPGQTDHCRTLLCTPAEFVSSMDQGALHPRWRWVNGPSVDRPKRPMRSVS
jgi:hypothetical protein